jgi:hypothetical protein
MHKVVVFASLLLIVLAAGCKRNERVQTYPTKGQLFINNKAPKGAIVGLHPVSSDFDMRKSRPAAPVLEDGSFAFSTYDVKDGAPTGEYIVTIFWYQHPDSPEQGEDRLMGKYSDPKKSSIRVTIKEGGNELEPIKLEDVKLLN